MIRKHIVSAAGLVIIVVSALTTSCGENIYSWTEQTEPAFVGNAGTAGEIPDYIGVPYVELGSSSSLFSEEEVTVNSYESYSGLDVLGRCGTAQACVGQDLMPYEDREDISDVKPSGWINKTYDFIEGGYLYNRCHLIGFQLSGENDNDRNLITGTRYMNTEGMLPFENIVAQYVRETNNHVMYRVTPVFEGENLVASGVRMEAESVEDKGEGVRFHVYVYNVQPGVLIDYETGESRPVNGEETKENNCQQYVLNENTKKFHLPRCSSVEKMKEINKKKYTGIRESLIKQGYTLCGLCDP